MRSAKWTRHRVTGKHSTVDSAVRDETWHSALELGRLTGPRSHEDLVQELGPLYVASRRFGLKQMEKLERMTGPCRSLYPMVLC